MKITLTAMPGGPGLPAGLDGAVAELTLRPDGASVDAEIRIPGRDAGPGLELGQVAYEAYRVSCDGRSVAGDLLPDWAGQRPEIREHWRAAADGVAMWLSMRDAPVPPG